MDSNIPVPKPRPSPLPRLTAVDTSMKKPIPKPRHRVMKDAESDSSHANDVTGVNDGKTDFPDSEGVQVKVPPTRMKNELKSDSENIHRGRFVLDGTRTVGAKLEKSVRNIAKRLTVRPPSPAKEAAVTLPRISRSQSLPSEDIFQSISFNSPLVRDNESHETLVEGEEVAEEEEGIYNSAPPPVYPPPPLPDESVYDEVQSVTSNHSSHYSDSIRSASVLNSQTDSVYDDVAIVGRRSGGRSRPRIISQICSSDTNKTDVVDSVMRSDSWTYQEIGPGDGGDMTDTNSDYYFMNSRDSSSYVSCRTRSCSSITPSVLSELDALGYASGEDMFDDERSSSSPARSSTSQSISVQNELYDNWEPKSSSNIPVVAVRRPNEGRKLPSKSVILEFDPLFDSSLQDSGSHSKSENLLCLTENKEVKPIKCSPYGKISKLVKQAQIDEFSVKEEQLSPPPIPPRRIDSISFTAIEEQLISPHVECTNDLVVPPRKVVHIFDADTVEYSPSGHPADDQISEASISVAGSSDGSQEESPSKQRRNLVRWTSMKRAMKIVADSTRPLRSPSMIRKNGRSGSKEQSSNDATSVVTDKHVVERPDVLANTSLSHSGMVYKMAINKERTQDHVQRWCMLAEGKLSFYTDQSGSSVRETISLSSILSVHVVLDQKLSTDGDCFEINTSSKNRFILGTSGTSERRVWMQKILESMTNGFPLRIISEFSRAGWCFLKEGISGTWSPAWILIHRRMLYYSIGNLGIQEIDLRKARCIVLQDPDKDVVSLKVSEKGPLILVDCQVQALYLRMDTSRETTSWQKEIRAAAVDNGPNLSQQQLTKDDIPCIVDKCIKFVYAHGSMSEGIYRRSGTNSSVTRLLELFRLDAFAVQLSRQEYTEYDISSVLKRFFRDLPEPLLTTELHGQFCDIAAGKCGKDRVAVYRRTLEQLPPVNFLTARKLIGHLHFIHLQREKNRMPMENLAAIWGPTLMHIETITTTESFEQSKLETAAIADLILLYPQLFEVDAEEREREKRMQEVLERYHASNNASQNKPSGELHVWIYLESKDSGNCVNVRLGPQKTAGEVCTELANKMPFAAHELGLEEVICGGSLVRMLHFSEKVLDTVLRWGYWDDADRKDNALILKRNELYREVLPLARPPLAMCAELRYADSTTRSFKTFLFEFSQAKLCYYKDKRGSIKVQEWNIEDIIWYLGFEPKKNPQMRWSITFIEKSKPCKRTKERPYFGSTIAGSTKEEQLRWMAALLIGEYPQGLMMSPVLLP